MVVKLSHSQIESWQTCKKLWWYKYMKKAELIKRKAYFLYGKAVHAFLEAHYMGLPPKRELERVFEEHLRRNPASKEEIDELELDKARLLGICTAYPKAYPDDKDRFKHIMAERKAPEIELVPGMVYYGYIDMLVKDAEGWWILETKTVAPSVLSRDDGAYMRRTKLDNQILGYCVLAHELLGEWPQGVIYNVIRKSALRKKKGKGVLDLQKRVYAEYTQQWKEKQCFQRWPVLFSKQDIERWWRDMRYEAELIKQAMDAGKDAVCPMSTGACTSKFGECEFLKACENRGKLSKSLYRKKER